MQVELNPTEFLSISCGSETNEYVIDECMEVLVLMPDTSFASLV